MMYSRLTFSTLAFVASLLATSCFAKDSPAGSPISTDDHHKCLEQGFAPTDPANKETEAYYRCRASLLNQKIESANPIIANLNPVSIKKNKEMKQAAAAFEAQADASSQANKRERDTERAAWQASETSKIEKFKQQDHQSCLEKGYFIGKWEDPRTEAYFTCRQQTAESRINPPDSLTEYRPTELPDAVRAFKNDAEKAKEAFNARDYQDHYRCLDQGLFPGAMEDPITSKYYACRADLARDGLGEVVAEIFMEDATKARKVSEQHTSCELRGLMKGSASYDVCRETLARYDACLSSHRASMKKVSGKGDSGPRECEQIIQLLKTN